MTGVCQGLSSLALWGGKIRDPGNEVVDVNTGTDKNKLYDSRNCYQLNSVMWSKATKSEKTLLHLKCKLHTQSNVSTILRGVPSP